MMNAGLVAAGEVRIVIPTVYRNNYLAALRGATHNGVFEALYAALPRCRGQDPHHRRRGPASHPGSRPPLTNDEADDQLTGAYHRRVGSSEEEGR